MGTFVWIFIAVLLLCGCQARPKASVKKVSEITRIQVDNEETKVIIFLYSWHQGNTRKIANEMSSGINALILNINEMNTDSLDFTALEEYNLIGFGSGIDSGKHYQLMLDFAEKLPNVQNKKAFVFSTCGFYSEKQKESNHETLRGILQNKGFVIVGEYACPGHNTNSFLKYFGGMNKNRPNADDLRNAGLFAKELLSK